jgi:hypothetical protein
MKRYAAAVGIVLAGAVGVAACDGGDGSRSSSTAPVKDPAIGATECGTYSGRGCAPKSRRVDLKPPTFSNPTEITNPLNPIARLRSALLLGHVEGTPLRVETTLLPGAKTIEWGGQKVKALQSQYTAILGGRIQEVAIDWYAQDDAGHVWYLGEDVFNYTDGTVADTEGSWQAGKDGPGAVIMPAHPEVGDVYRPENLPAIVFEEVTVKSVGETERGPRGPVEGAIVVDELHLDGTREEKTFAPGYGEFKTGTEDEREDLAVAVPADALDERMPAELVRLSSAASGMLGSAQAEDWQGAAATLKRARADWQRVQGGGVPPLLADEMNDGLRRVGRAVEARRPAQAGLAALDVGLAALDLRLQYRPPAEIDRGRFEHWASRTLVHAAAGDRTGVAGDVALMEWIRDRIAHTLDAHARSELDSGLRELRAAADAGSAGAAADHAARVAALLR